MRQHLSVFLLACLLLATGGINPSVGAAPPLPQAETTAAQPAREPAAIPSELSATPPETALVPSTSAASTGGLPAGGTATELNSLNIDSADIFSDTGSNTEQLGYDVSPASDVNGDGYADVIVGAPGYNANDGAAYVYYGTANGLTDVAVDSVPAPTQLEGESGATASFGEAVSTAGDVNGDGFADVIVGAPGYNTSDGAAYIFLGTDTGIETSPTLTITAALTGNPGEELGISVGTAGNVDGDGFDDVVIGTRAKKVYIVYGQNDVDAASPQPIENISSEANGFGVSVDTAGDVDGDGYAELIVGADIGGHMFLYAGDAGGIGATATLTITNAISDFGAHVSPGGDVNGDGYADVLVRDSNEAYIYLGGNTSGLPTLTEVNTTNPLTIGGEGAIGPAGDIDGDGFADILIQSGSAQVTLYRGGPGDASSFDPPVFDAPLDVDTNLGAIWALDTAGDTDGDGFADILIGAPTAGANDGAFYVYRGESGSLSNDENYESIQNTSGDSNFGNRVVSAGDLNGDGYGDVAISSWGESKIYIYYGGPNGVVDDADITSNIEADVVLEDLSGDGTDSSAGFAIASAGDVDGDGYEDLLIGDPNKEPGYVYLYCGAPTGINETSYSQVIQGQSLMSDDHFGWSISGAGDVDGDGFTDIIVGAPLQDINGDQDNGKVFVYYGREDFCTSAPIAADEADWTLSTEPSTTERTDTTQLGHKVSTAGDVNGDGYADIIVSATNARIEGQKQAGFAMVYHGSADGLPTTSPIIDNPDWVFEGELDERVGHDVSTAGDVNGDGFSDVLVTASDPNASDEVRPVRLFHGSATGLTDTVNATLRATFGFCQICDLTEPYRQYNIAHTAGDVNGDGLSDVIVARSTPSADQRGATIYLGSDVTTTGLTGQHTDTALRITNSPVITLTAEKAVNDENKMSYGVSPAGDVNGDGYADVIVGTAGSYVSIYYGNDGQGRHMLPSQLRTESDTRISYLGRSDSRRAARLSLLGYTPLGGTVPVVLEWQATPLGTSFDAGTGLLTGITSSALTQGIPITATMSGTEAGTPYSWRTRLRYPAGNRLGQSASRWYRLPRNAQTEQDFRTKGGVVLLTSPENPLIIGTQSTLTADLNVPDAVAEQYTWTRDLSNPADLPDDDGNPFTTSTDTIFYTYPTNGIYTAQVVVDYTIGGVGETLTVTDTATIAVVPDIDNIAVFLSADNPAIVGTPAQLAATIFGVNPGGYIWDFGDGTTAETTRLPLPNPDVVNHIYDSIGVYTATVDVFYEGSDDPLRRQIQVEVVDQELDGLDPSYTPQKSTYFVGEPINFGASIAAGTNPVYTWQFGNGTQRTGISQSYAYPEPGTYNVTVTVENSRGQLSASVATITVVEQPIVGPLTAENDSPTIFGNTTTLSATVVDGTNVYYMWDFGDGEQTVTKDQQVDHVYLAVGEFAATVTVSNSVTAETVIQPAQTNVTIVDRIIEGLTAINDSPTMLGNTTTLTASVKQGTNVEYQWDFTDGTVTDWTTSPTATHTFAQAGTYIVTVRARNSATQEVYRATTDAVVVGPNLAISKTANAPAVAAGDLITYTLRIENSGNYTATSLIISDQLPSGATFVEAPFADGSGNGQLSNGTVTWAVDELGPDAEVAVLLVVTGESTLINDTYSVRTEDPFGLNVVGSSPVNVVVQDDTSTTLYLPLIAKPGPVPEELPDLVGTFSLSPAKTTYNANELVTISGRVTNQGNAPSTESFWVDLFINPTTPPTPGDIPTIWNLRCEQPCIGISWAITETLQPGESFTFNSTTESYHSEYTIWQGYFDTNPTSLYLYVDPWAAEGATNREQGAVVEIQEDNNRTEIENLTVEGAKTRISRIPKRVLPPRPDLNAHP